MDEKRKTQLSVLDAVTNDHRKKILILKLNNYFLFKRENRVRVIIKYGLGKPRIYYIAGFFSQVCCFIKVKQLRTHHSLA